MDECGGDGDENVLVEHVEHVERVELVELVELVERVEARVWRVEDGWFGWTMRDASAGSQ